MATRVLERLVEWLHAFVPRIDDRLFRFGVCIVTLLLTLLLRQALARFAIRRIKRTSGSSERGMEERVWNALLLPLAGLLLVFGIYAALVTLRLPVDGRQLIESGTRVAFIAVLLWGAMAGGAAAFDYAARSNRNRSHGVATFLPLIKRIVGSVFALFSLLVIAEALGADVRTFLAGLGIGGLAVALAAQDTIANMFGSLVVVLDHPFYTGDLVKIGGNEGTVEDIGLRSTRLRTAARTLIAIPNKTVAMETITNLSRLPQRRVEQTIALSNETRPEQIQTILDSLRAFLGVDPGVQGGTYTVHFSDFGASSLNLSMVYFTADPDWQKHLEVRERINLRALSAISAAGAHLAPSSPPSPAPPGS